MTIHNKLRITIVSLFVFIVGLVGLNFFTFNEIKGDAPAVNASGSLRMRAYQLAWLSARLVTADADEAADLRRSMRTRIEEYEHILTGLSAGDAELGIRPAADPAIASELAVLRPQWEDYRAQVYAVLDSRTTEEKYAANARVAAAVVPYAEAVDDLVTAYDQANQAKVRLSQQLEMAVIVLSLIIFVGSSYVMIRHVLRPLYALTASFREVAGKEADLTQRLEAERYDEIGRIVHSFNSFVSDLRHLMQRAKACSAEVSGLSDNLWKASVDNSRAVEYNAVAVTTVAASASEQNDNIRMLAESVAGISDHMAQMQAQAQAESVNRAALLSSIEAVRACAQVAAAASAEVAKEAETIADQTQDSAAAIQQQTASLESFAAAAEHLKGLAGELDGLVGRFKV